MFKRIVAMVLMAVCLVLLFVSAVQADSIVDSGATLPANPVIGQEFLHTPIGRSILYMFDGANWKAERSFGAMTVYVDPTGTNDLEHGMGTGSNAFQTIQYAKDFIPSPYDRDVTVNIAAGTYNESLILDSKWPSGSSGAHLIFKGALTQVATGTMDSAVQGTGATQGSITKAGAMTGYAKKLIYANNEYRVIDSVTANTATITGTWSTAPSGTYTIYDWGTRVTGERSLLVRNGQIADQFYFVWFNGNSNDVLLHDHASAAFYQCKFSSYFGSEVYSYAACEQCLFNVYNNNLLAYMGSGIELLQCNIAYTNTVARYAIILQLSSCLLFDGGSVIDCGSVAGTIGIYCSEGSAIHFDPAYLPSWGYARIRNCTYGMSALQVSSITGTANIQYSGNSINEVPTAASYGYID